MTSKLFKVAGITVHGDSTKVRFTDDLIRRIKQFTKGGATRADFVELPSAMTKVDAIKYLQGHEKFQSASDQSVLADALSDRQKGTTKGEVKVRKTKAKPSLDAIKARSKKVKTETSENTTA